MRTFRHLGIVLLALLLLPSAGSAQVLDRIVAVVNRRIILQSELQIAVHYECLLNGRDPGTLGANDYSSALQRLIDQELISQQMIQAGFAGAAPDEIATQVQAIRRQLHQEDDQKWQALLARYSLSPADFARRTAAQLNILRFLDLRFRPSIHVDAVTVETYYHQQFAPEMERRGKTPPPLKEVAGKIENILLEQGVDDLLHAWLDSLRQQSDIHIGEPQSPQPEGVNR